MSKNEKRIKFWFGNDSYGISEALKEERGSAVLTDSSVEVASFDFSSVEERKGAENNLLNALRGASLFSSQKLVIIKNFFSSKKNKDKDEDGDLKIENASLGVAGDFEDVLLDTISRNFSDRIVFVEERFLDKRSKAYKFFEKIIKDGDGEQREFAIPLQFEFNSWLEKTIEKRGGKISKQNINRLAVLLGRGMEQKERGSVIAAYDLHQASMEIDKLVAYCDGSEITAEDIELLVSSSVDMNIFSLIESIGNRDKGKALKIISGQIERGFNENYILTMLVYHFRNLIIVKGLVEAGVGLEDIVRTTKMHPFVAQKNIQYCKNLSREHLFAVYGKLYNADISIKNGSMDPELALDLLVVAI